MEYKKAARYGDTIIVRASDAGEKMFSHIVSDRNTGVELVRARTVWA
jgi:hypothetical protein